MSKKEIRIYTIHSQKGGVGKTSLAIAIAGWSSSEHKLKTLIVDCDLTGTSIIDLFWKRDSSKQNGKRIHYLNKLLLASPPVFEQYEKGNMDKIYCRAVPDYKNLYYIPSSPVLKDIRRIVALISQEDMLHFFQSRMTDILELAQKSGFETIIIDNPPGLFGLSRATINLKALSKCNWNKRVFFVITPDPMDYRASLASFSDYWEERKQPNQRKTEVDNLYVLLNKARVDPVLTWRRILNELESPDCFPDKRTVNKTVLNYIDSRLRKVGAKTCPFVRGFDMNYVLDTVQQAMKKQKSTEGGMEGWCRMVKDMADL